MKLVMQNGVTITIEKITKKKGMYLDKTWVDLFAHWKDKETGLRCSARVERVSKGIYQETL